MQIKKVGIHKWLDMHGGRTVADVETDEIGNKYIMLQNGNKGSYRSYLPLHLLEEMDKSEGVYKSGDNGLTMSV